MKRRTLILLGSALILAVVVTIAFLFLNPPSNSAAPVEFDGQRAYQDVITQVAFGPRLPGSPAHTQTIDWIQSELDKAGWEVSLQEVEYAGHLLRNVIGTRGTGSDWVILGAHFDSRQVADNDPNPDERDQPVPGANDGASGVAVLLELARTLPADLPKQITLVFFDGEDQGNLPGWDWILGSKAYAEALPGQPSAAVVVDMIGDAALNIHLERNSSPELMQEIWGTAAELGYQDKFINEYKYSMLDDHLPFLNRGIPSADLIDFDYPYWHTTGDTPDKVSAESLHVVGDTLWHWLQKDELPDS
jgi:glutaminyl-peptide cyclotransferase